MKALDTLIEGYNQFREDYTCPENAQMRERVSGAQTPRVMVIGCSDARVNPALLTRADLGDIFMVCNVANLVPPYKAEKHTHHSTSAAIEFAVLHLGVEDIIILGHSRCGGIRTLMAGNTRTQDGEYSFIEPWMDIVHPAKQRVLARCSDLTQEEQAHECEKESLLSSLDNLASFPWVRKALDAGTLRIHAWYFDLATGDILAHDPGDNGFHRLPIVKRPAA